MNLHCFLDHEDFKNPNDYLWALENIFNEDNKTETTSLVISQDSKFLFASDNTGNIVKL